MRGKDSFSVFEQVALLQNTSKGITNSVYLFGGSLAVHKLGSKESLATDLLEEALLRSWYSSNDASFSLGVSTASSQLHLEDPPERRHKEIEVIHLWYLIHKAFQTSHEFGGIEIMQDIEVESMFSTIDQSVSVCASEGSATYLGSLNSLQNIPSHNR